MTLKLIRALAVLTFGLLLNATACADDSNWFRDLLPDTVPRSALFTMDGNHVFDADLIRDDSGTYHLYFTYFPEQYGFAGWKQQAQIGHATASAATGPFRFEGVALPRRGNGMWDGASTVNPDVLQFDGRYYLYYVGIPEGADDRQRVGVAVADDPAGPWQRADAPLLDVPQYGLYFTSTPAVMLTPARNILMVYKTCEAGRAFQDEQTGEWFGARVHMPAFAAQPLGPFEVYAKPMYRPAELVAMKPPVRHYTDDHVEWYYQGSYWGLIKDMGQQLHYQVGSPGDRSLMLMQSANGLDWQVAAHPFVASYAVKWSDGVTTNFDRLEMPKIYFEDGRPAVLLRGAYLRGPRFEMSGNLIVPLHEAAPR